MRQRALVRVAAASKKKKEKDRAPSLAPKDVKRKSEGKYDRPLKKGPVVPVGDKLKKSSPLKPSHGVGKGLMTLTGLVTQGPVRRLLTHKEHTVEVIESIIKDTDMDPCAEQTTEELGASGLFDLSRVCPFFIFIFFSLIYCSIADSCSICRL